MLLLYCLKIFIYYFVLLHFLRTIMKRLCFGLLVALSWIFFGWGFAEWDVIDTGFYQKDVIRYNSNSEYELKEKQSNFYESTEFKHLIINIGKNIWYFVWLVIIFYIISSIFLCLIFKKMWYKQWKGIIPLYNIYLLYKTIWIKKLFRLLLTIIPITIIFSFLFLFLGYWLDYPHNCGHECHLHSPIYYIFNLVSEILISFSWLIIIIWVIFPYYHLFRKFGWGKLYSVLWTIFLPIWIWVLWFGKFKYQWEKLDEKRDN